MPDARTHDGITIVTGATLAPLTYIAQIGNDIPTEAALTQAGLLTIAHLLSGIMFSPDLDIDSAIDDRWGIFFWIWRPYARIVPHRHFWSHGLILPPLLRLLYFYAVVVGLLIGGTWLLSLIGIIVPTYHTRLTDTLLGLARDYPAQVLAVLIGFITGGAAHTIADWLVTRGKRFLRWFGITPGRNYDDHDRYVPRRPRRRARS